MENNRGHIQCIVKNEQKIIALYTTKTPVHNSRKHRGARDGHAANVRVGEKGGGEAMFCDSSHDSDVACALRWCDVWQPQTTCGLVEPPSAIGAQCLSSSTKAEDRHNQVCCTQ